MEWLEYLWSGPAIGFYCGAVAMRFWIGARRDDSFTDKTGKRWE